MKRLFLGRLTLRTATLVLIEHELIVLAVTLAAAIRFDPGVVAAELTNGSLLWRASLIAGVLQVALHYCDLYDLRTLSDRRDLVVGLIQALGGASLILAVLYYWLPQLIIGRGVFVIASAFVIVLVAGWRLAFEWFALRVGPAERLLIVGTGGAAVALARELFDRRQELGVELVGFVDADPKLRRHVAHQSWCRRHDQRDPHDCPRAQGRSGRGEPRRRARQAADGRPPRA